MCVLRAQAKNLAVNQGIPYIELPRISGRRLMEAVAPIMGVPIPAHLTELRGAPLPMLPAASEHAEEAAALLRHLMPPMQQPALQSPQAKPGILNALKTTPAGPRLQGLTTIGQANSGQLTVLKTTPATTPYHPMIGQVSPEQTMATTATPPTTPYELTIGDILSSVNVKGVQDARKTQRTQRQASQYMAPMGPSTRVANSMDTSAHAGQDEAVQQHETDVSSVLLENGLLVDGGLLGEGVSEDRQSLVPSNPTARLGLRHRVVRPIKHGRRIRDGRRLRKAQEEKELW